jgi:pyrroloquinoline quinone biosynthesis protein B
MPRMKKFLEQNGPWSQLVSLENISINQINSTSKIAIDQNVTIQPIEVPHRAEFSETVGYKIYGPNKTVLFIPDIDKWYLWEKSIIDEIKQVDYALIDATFYDSKEVNYRDLSEIPHPFVVESMELFDSIKDEEKNKIFFIHLNHTNPLLNKDSDQYKFVKSQGYNVAKEGMKLKL